jgi:cytochrome c6
MLQLPFSKMLCSVLSSLVGLALVLLLALSGIAGPVWATVEEPQATSQGEQLFAQHCSGCHINGGNIIRRGKTLKLAALQRQGIESPEAIALIAAGGIGQMGGYGAVLGDGGPAAVADYVWQQAQAGWLRPT